MNNFSCKKWRPATGPYLFLCWFLGVLLALPGCAPPALVPETGKDGNAELEAKWGIRPESINLTAAGHLIDFRYRITDPDKAAKITADPKLITYLQDQASGVKLAVPRPPKVGALRQTARKPETDRIYFTLFNNPGRVVKQGSRVTIVMGDFRAEDLVVQ